MRVAWAPGSMFDKGGGRGQALLRNLSQAAARRRPRSSAALPRIVEIYNALCSPFIEQSIPLHTSSHTFHYDFGEIGSAVRRVARVFCRWRKVAGPAQAWAK